MRKWILLTSLFFCLLFYAFRDFLSNGPKFWGIQIEINGRVVEVQNNSSITVRSDDRVFLKEVQTNLPLNLGISLSSDRLDIEALLSSPQRIGEVLSWDLEENDFYISVSFRHLPLGQVTLKVTPLVEDWLERASLILDPERRLNFLWRGIEATYYALPLVKEYIEYLPKIERQRRDEFLLRLDPHRLQDEGLLWTMFNMAKEVEDGLLVERYGREILRVNPNDNQVLWAIGRFWEEKNEHKRAEAYYREGLEVGTGSKRELVLGLCRVLIAQGQLLAAKECLQGLTPEQGDQEYFQLLANVSKELNDVKTYVDAMKGYFSLKPGDLEGRIEFLKFLLENNLDQEVLFYTKDILVKAIGEPEILIKLADILERFKKKDLLEETYRVLLEEGISTDVILFNLGTLAYENEDYVNAKKYLETYITKVENDTLALKILLDIYRKEKNSSKVLKTAQRLIELGTNEVWLYELIYNEYLKLRDYKSAIRVCEEASKSFPKEKSFHECLITSFLQEGNLKEAEKTLVAYLNRFPTDQGMVLRLAEVRQAMEDKAGALDALERYLKLRPEDQEVQGRYLELKIQYLKEQER